MVLARPLLSVSVNVSREQGYIALQLSWESIARYSHARQRGWQGSRGNPAAVEAVPVICHLRSFGYAFPVPHGSVSLYRAGRKEGS